MRKLFFVLLFLPVIGFAQHQLHVVVTGVTSSDGTINVAIYNSEEHFLETGQLYKGIIVKSEKNSVNAVFNDLPEGTYALAVFHDENANEELDTNFFGIPKEPLGFSIGKLKTFGPPSFEECAFILDANMEIGVPLKK